MGVVSPCTWECQAAMLLAGLALHTYLATDRRTSLELLGFFVAKNAMENPGVLRICGNKKPRDQTCETIQTYILSIYALYLHTYLCIYNNIYVHWVRRYRSHDAFIDIWTSACLQSTGSHKRFRVFQGLILRVPSKAK